VKHVLAEKEIMEKMDHPCLIALAGNILMQNSKVIALLYFPL
jgi:hypothetical protein